MLNIAPKPQSRPRFTKRGFAYEEKGMKQWKENIRYELYARQLKRIEQGALYVGLNFYIYPPKYICKSNTKHPLENRQLEQIFVEKKPDLDNYIKAVLDASNGILYKDDGQIVALSSQKMYSYHPRIEIEIKKMEETE